MGVNEVSVEVSGIRSRKFRESCRGYSEQTSSTKTCISQCLTETTNVTNQRFWMTLKQPYSVSLCLFSALNIFSRIDYSAAWHFRPLRQETDV